MLAALLMATAVSSPSVAADPRYGVPPDESLGQLAGARVTDATGMARDDFDPVAIGDGALARGDAMPAWAWDVGELAVHLDFDPERAFEFVRDHTRYEPYRGILRGASGTLAARAGNAVDRALLLSALLDEMLIPNRFAFARLDPASAEQLVERALLGDVQPLDAQPSYPTETILARAGRDYALLRGALGDRIDTFAGDEWAAGIEAATDHVWVQRAMTADWQDLDPSLPGTLPGETLAAPQSISEQPPDMEPWIIDIEVLVEHLDGGGLTERSVLHHQLDAVGALEDGAFLLFRPELGAIAGAVTEQLTGSEPWTAALLMGSEEVVGEGFSIGGPGSDPMGDAVDAPELASVRLVVSVHGPGTQPESATHAILDRVPPDMRALASPLGSDDLGPLAVAEMAPLPLAAFRHIVISTGATNLRMHEYRRAALVAFMGTLLDEERADTYGIGGRLWPLVVADEGMVIASEQVAVPGAGVADGGRSYVARPRVFMTTIGPDPTDAGRQSSSIDLLLDGVRVLRSAHAQEGDTARGRLWYGVMQAAIETEFGLHRLPSDLAADAEFEGVSHAMTEPLQVIDPDPAPVLPEGTARALADAAADGRIVVVPGDIASARAWWTIDPRTGVARSVLDPGLGGVAQHLADDPWREGRFDYGTNLKHDGGVYLVRHGNYKPPPRVPSFWNRPICGSSSQYVAVVDCVPLRAALPFAFLGLTVSFLVEAAAIQVAWGW